MREKIKKWEELKEVVEKAKGKGRSIVFTNGCFDLIHVGHTRYLEEAKKYGDIFIVAVNSDSSVRAIKGMNRPIISEDERAEVVAALGCVDYVTTFSEPDPLRLITYLKPTYLVKGGDWAADSIIGKEVVEAEGGKVIRIPVIEGAAATNIVQVVVERYCKEKVEAKVEVKEKARRIRLLILDVDGVMTDGRIVYTDGGGEIKAFDVKDGHGVKLLMRGGVDVAILTGRESRVVLHRANNLGIDMVFQGAKDKLRVFEEILKAKGLKDEEVCYIGD
ncbi:MAG TPA: adenylyltransferase/cytidyltransferase family protein, partial [Thermodesulfobacteriota bacterium]|nr:adenylyltransferase/cytidyltransferase family protein [Thermodesulfobacteriota bacterium]